MWISAGADQCEAHGQCAMVSQELFPLDEDGYTTLAHAPRQVPADSEDLGRRGVDACPLRVLRISGTRPADSGVPGSA
jgi:ferredoxin